jgi:hypothetical protein
MFFLNSPAPDFDEVRPQNPVGLYTSCVPYSSYMSSQFYYKGLDFHEPNNSTLPVYITNFFVT